MKKSIYFYLVLILMCNNACYKDLGNYDYNRLPEIQIMGVESDYGVKMIFEDSLIIQPEIVFGIEKSDNFDMNWYSIENDKLKLISEGKDLRINLSKSGVNNFLFEVIHKKYEISARVKTRVSVVSQMQRGIYILKETKDANTDMDAFIRTGESEFKLFTNLITEKLGEPMLGKPVSLDYWDWMYTQKTGDGIEQTMKRVIRPASQKDIRMFHMEDLSYIGGMKDLFYDPIEGDLKIEALKSIPDLTILIYNNGKVRTLANKRASKFQMEYTGNYEIFPDLCYAKKKGDYVVFDKVTCSFKLVGSTTTRLFDFADEVYPGYFQPMNNLNSEILFLGRAEGNLPPLRDYAGIGYSILHPKGEPDSLKLYYMTLNTLARNMTNGRSIVDRVEILPQGLSIKRGKLFTMHSYEKMLFYVIDNKVYGYNLDTKKESIVINDVDFPEGKIPNEITYMKHVKTEYDDQHQNFDHLFVGGYKSGNYILYVFKVSNGQLSGNPLTFEGTGKIKDIRYTSLGRNGIDDFYFW